MSRINVKCEVRTYPEDEKSYTWMIVRNHWNENRKVVVSIGDGAEYVFLAADLIQAIHNATNAHQEVL